MKNIIYTLALLISFSSFGQVDIKQGERIIYYESGEIKLKVNYVECLISLHVPRFTD